MAETLQQTYNNMVARPLQVLEIFNDFFGEDKVDMQGLPSFEQAEEHLRAEDNHWLTRNADNIFILVHFPRVKVTNEYDKFTYVNHLYAKVDIDIEGKLKTKFTLNRSEYTVQHFINNYMHSHICSIPTDNFEAFQIPCTGRGPINNTICSLLHDFDEDLWRLFCLELDKFVQVESIAGTPYHRLEELSDLRRGLELISGAIRYQNNLNPYHLGRYRQPVLSLPVIAAFTKHLIDSNILRFTYAGEKYQLAMSCSEYYIAVSNLFINWYNREFAAGRVTASYSQLVDARILLDCKFMNGQIYKVLNYYNGNAHYSQYVGRRVCTFKGHPVTITFSDAGNTAEEDNNIVVLNNNILNYIATKLLNVINFRYGNSDETHNEEGVYYL